MHLQTLSWARLPKAQRDAKLFRFGITPDELRRARSLRPRERLLEAARTATTIDDEPNSDLIDFIAGYEARGRLYHYFRTVESLLTSVEPRGKPKSLSKIELKSGEFDVAVVVPHVIQGYPVHMEKGTKPQRFAVW